MRAIDDTKFRAILASFGEVYAKTISAPLASLFWESLKDLAIEQVDLGARRWIKHGGHFPKPADIRKMVTESEQAAPKKQHADEREAEEPQDHLLFFANRLFLEYLFGRSGLGSAGRMGEYVASAKLLAARKELRALVDEFTGFIREGDELATPAAFVEMLQARLERIAPMEPVTAKTFRRTIADPRGKIPFEPYMARQLSARYTPLAK